MRSIHFVLLSAASFVNASGSACSQSQLQDYVFKTSCECPGKLSDCLTGVDIGYLDKIQQCFVDNGCTAAEAVKGTDWYATDCRASTDYEAHGELKRRAQSTTADDTIAADVQTSSKNAAETTTADDATTTDSQAKVVAAATKDDAVTTTSATTAASTTASAATTSSAASTSDTTTASTTTGPSSTTSTSSQSSVTTSTTSTTSALVCSITVQASASICSYTTTGKSSRKLGCTPTTTPSATCAPGVICQVDNGRSVCILRDDHLTTSGAIVTSIFSIAIAGIAITILVLNLQSRNSAKRAKLERQALLGSGNMEMQGESKAPEISYSQQHNSSDNDIPLMSPNGTSYQQMGDTSNGAHPALGGRR